jgi:hypothetical protein
LLFAVFIAGRVPLGKGLYRQRFALRAGRMVVVVFDEGCAQNPKRMLRERP